MLRLSPSFPSWQFDFSSVCQAIDMPHLLDQRDLTKRGTLVLQAYKT
jgi:hypothetical protein